MASDARWPQRGRARRGWRALAVVIVAAAVLPSAAAAEPRPSIPEPTEVEKENARNLMDQGVDREEAKDYAAALKYYQAAHALVRLPMTGMAVARAQEGLKLYVEALESAAEVKRLPRRPRETPAYDRARSEADALIARLSKLVPAPQAGAGGARADSAPSDDGEPAPAGPPDEGQEPGAEEDAGGGAPALAWIGFGVGAAGLAVGAITGVMTLSEGAALEERCGTVGCAQSEIDAASVTANISNVGFAVGAAGVGVGIVALLLSGGGGARAAAPRPAVQVAPWAGPGITVRGVF